MQPRKQYLYECSACGKPFKAGPFVPAFFACDYCVIPPRGCWTDGQDTAAITSEVVEYCVSLLKCPVCNGFLWLNEAQTLAETRYAGSDQRWPEAKYCRRPTEHDYLQALELGLGTNPGKIHYLRMRAWWAANDGDPACPRSSPHVQRSPRALRNMTSLLEPSEESDEGHRLMKAELARELGLFEEAKRLLSPPIGGDYRNAAKVIAGLTEREQTGIAIISRR
jgi:hypothetical protein